jgi:hypothetical protein
LHGQLDQSVVADISMAFVESPLPEFLPPPVLMTSIKLKVVGSFRLEVN